MNVLQNFQYRRVSLISKRWFHVRSWLRRPVNEKEKEIMREKVLKGESTEDKASLREKIIKGDGSGHDDPLEGPGVTLLASVCFLFPIGCFYYGTVNSRKRWEAEVIEHLLKRKMEAPPVPLPQELNHVHDMEFRHVQVKGIFDHSHELFLGPRDFVHADSMGVGVDVFSVFPAQSGWNVITPLHLSDRDERILVNRGWVPLDGKDPNTRKEAQVSTEVDIDGFVRLSEHRNEFTPPIDFEDDEWHIRDVTAMSRKLKTAPVFIDADATSTIPGGPIGGQTRVMFRSARSHQIHSYMGYAMSAFSLYIWLKKFVKVY